MMYKASKGRRQDCHKFIRTTGFRSLSGYRRSVTHSSTADSEHNSCSLCDSVDSSGEYSAVSGVDGCLSAVSTSGVSGFAAVSTGGVSGLAAVGRI